MIKIESPFDIIKILGKSLYDEVSNIDKKRNYFIINRMLSRSLPEVAMNMSLLKITPESVVDYWHFAFAELSKTNQGNNTLNFVKKTLYVSLTTQKKSEKSKLDKDLCNEFMNVSKIGKKEFDILIKYYESDTIKYIKKFSKMLETTK